MVLEEKIKEILKKIFEGKDFHLIDVKIRGEKKNKIAEIYIDSENEIDLDKLSKISKDINEIIDSDEISGELLKIVVSSPGVENSFRFIWQLKKHINRILEFSVNGVKNSGKLISVDESTDELTFEIYEKKKEITVYKNRFNDIESIKVKLPF